MRQLPSTVDNANPTASPAKQTFVPGALIRDQLFGIYVAYKLSATDILANSEEISARIADRRDRPPSTMLKLRKA